MRARGSRTTSATTRPSCACQMAQTPPPGNPVGLACLKPSLGFPGLPHLMNPSPTLTLNPFDSIATYSSPCINAERVLLAGEALCLQLVLQCLPIRLDQCRQHILPGNPSKRRGQYSSQWSGHICSCTPPQPGMAFRSPYLRLSLFFVLVPRSRPPCNGGIQRDPATRELPYCS